MNLFFSSVVYLNVTDLKTYQVGWDTFCVKWSPHRAATSYRLKLSPADGTCTRKQTEPGVETSHPAAPQGLFVDKPSWNMVLEIMDDNPCVPPCCHNQEPEDKKSQCEDQKPATASPASHQRLSMALLFLCRHQIWRGRASPSRNRPVSFESPGE